MTFADSNHARMAAKRPKQFSKSYIGPWMERLGVSREDMQESADIKKSHMSLLISGKRSPSLDVALAIAKRLKIDVAALQRPPPSKDVLEGLKEFSPEVVAKLIENQRSR